MKNHWIEVHRRKKSKIWTAEFSKNGLYKLNARKVGIQSGQFTSGLLGQGSGRLSLIFRGALQNTSDHELLDFLSESAQGGMRDMISRLKKYSGVMTQQIEAHYELTGLDYETLGTGVDPNDIRLTFKFKNLHKIQVP